MNRNSIAESQKVIQINPEKNIHRKHFVRFYCMNIFSLYFILYSFEDFWNRFRFLLSFPVSVDFWSGCRFHLIKGPISALKFQNILFHIYKIMVYFMRQRKCTWKSLGNINWEVVKRKKILSIKHNCKCKKHYFFLIHLN